MFIKPQIYNLLGIAAFTTAAQVVCLMKRCRSTRCSLISAHIPLWHCDYHQEHTKFSKSSRTLGKYGAFPANLLIGRPFHLTYEILDKAEDQLYSDLRVVAASELHVDALADDGSSNPDSVEARGEEFDDADDSDAVGENGEVYVRSNQLTVDDTTKQTLTMGEIEELKKSGGASGKEIIAKILQSHSALDEKTNFSLAKYTLRKSKKYMRRFTALPLDVSLLTYWMLNEKDAARIMEIREEMLGLVASWSNAHFAGQNNNTKSISAENSNPIGRWLVIDDTGGLIVAALAERMGVLYPERIEGDRSETSKAVDGTGAVVQSHTVALGVASDSHLPGGNGNIGSDCEDDEPDHPSDKDDHVYSKKRPRRHVDMMSAIDNTITLIHPATQPNISLLSYFLYDPTSTSEQELVPSSSHPLHTHLKTISWLQLLHPDEDSACVEPEPVSSEVLSSWKSSKRGTYHRKRRRWERTVRVVKETRAGGFDSLVVATVMDPISVLRHTVPLLRGGAQITVYSPNVEPLAELTDAYSSTRKTAYINALSLDDAPEVPSDDFPVDPRLILAPSLQTARAREWQVLPGRTHPLMTSRGGAEGYLFTGTRVLPAERKLEARGRFSKKRKVDTNGETQSSPTSGMEHSYAGKRDGHEMNGA